MNIDVRIPKAALRKTWGECLAVTPPASLRDSLLAKSSQALSMIQAGQVRSTAANNQHTTFETGADSSLTAPQIVAMWTYLVDLFDQSKSDLGGAPADSDIEVQMEAYLRPVYGHTNNYMYLMKCLALVSILSMAGCKAMDSLIFHPLHVLHEERENNEAEKKAEASFTNANDWQSADEAIRLRTEAGK